MKVVDKVKELAAKKSCTPGQLALAWVHAQGSDVFPIPGTKRVKYLEVRPVTRAAHRVSAVLHMSAEPQAARGSRVLDAAWRMVTLTALIMSM